MAFGFDNTISTAACGPNLPTPSRSPSPALLARPSPKRTGLSAYRHLLPPPDSLPPPIDPSKKKLLPQHLDKIQFGRCPYCSVERRGFLVNHACLSCAYADSDLWWTMQVAVKLQAKYVRSMQRYSCVRIEASTHHPGFYHIDEGQGGEKAILPTLPNLSYWAQERLDECHLLALQCERSMLELLDAVQDMFLRPNSPVIQIEELRFGTTKFAQDGDGGVIHCAYLIELPGNRLFVFDPTGRQFGPERPIIASMEDHGRGFVDRTLFWEKYPLGHIKQEMESLEG